jgi:superkiller protein 3
VAFHNLGSIYAEQGRDSEAIRAFQAAIALEPDAEGYHNLGLVHYNSGDFLQALGCFERAIELDENFALGQYYVGLCLLKQGMYENAALKFKLSWKLDNRLVRVSYHLGVCLHKLEKYEAARNSLLEALDFFPEDGRVHYQLALTCDALGIPQEARQHYGQARAARTNGGSA